MKTYEFGKTSKGQTVNAYIIENINGIRVEFLDFGCILRQFWVPKSDGAYVNIVHGLDTVQAYEEDRCHFGAFVGRFASRIKDSRFSINGEEFVLTANDGPNHLHGCWNKKVFKASDLPARTLEEASKGIVFTYRSPDMEDGFPGNVEVKVTYILDDDNVIHMDYEAVSDSYTVINLTNHSYFNLSGHNSGNAMDQNILLFAHEYTPSDPEGIPTGEIASVEGTPMDLREMIPICSHLDDPAPALIKAKGYDHNYVLSEYTGSVRPAAIASSDITGITMHMATSMPGVHFYTSNYVSQGLIGKDEAIYGPRHAFCLEPQFFPDAIHHPAFPSPILRSGELYSHIIQLTFTTF